MSTFNEVLLIGHLGQNPEIFRIGNKPPFAKLQLATNKRWEKDGKQYERTDWHTVLFPARLVNVAEKHLKKGSKILIKGELQTRKWQDKEGKQHLATVISSHHFRFLDKANKEALNIPIEDVETTNEDIALEEAEIPF